MTFVDEAVIAVRSGAGGPGSASFHSEPFKPRGGPDGGDGGRGGSVFLEVTAHARDLSWLSEHRNQRAESGKSGARNNRHGGDATDLVVEVPSGTLVRDERGFVADMVGEGKRVEVARGGRGGRGNSVLAGPKNRAPRSAEPGEVGEEHTLQLELRTIADVGLVGLPSAGKSTLLAALTAARPKIAAYPFTTLTPNIGVAGGEDERFVVADVPGLIEGAHEGKGLGLKFLRHVSRCRVLACVVDAASPDPVVDIRILRSELASYDSALGERSELIVATKADLLDVAERSKVTGQLSTLGEVVVVSGESGEGVAGLSDQLRDMVADSPEVPATGSRRGPARQGFAGGEFADAVVLRPGRPEFVVEREGSGFRVTGRLIERLVADADLEDPRSVVELQGRLAKEGVDKVLTEAGAQRGDDVMIGSKAFEFIPEQEGS